jgi:hypothetical protein
MIALVEEARELIKDILVMETQKEEILSKKERARNSDSVLMYHRQALELEKTIQRRTEILRIMVRD